MKILFKICTLVLLVGVISCVDKKKEEAETEVAIEKIEAVEAELDQISEEIETKAEELEKSLDDLDDI